MTTATQRLAARVRELAPSQTLALAARAGQLKREGQPVISFAAGEPDFGSPEVAGAAAKAAIDRGETHYTPVPGTPEMKAAVIERVQRDTGAAVTPERVLVSTGAKQCLFNLLQALIDPGDEVVFASPYWVSYPAQVQLAGGRAVPVETRAEDDFRLDPDAVAAALGPRARVLILNTPCNPTGAVADPSDVEAVVRLALDEGVVVLSDEIYGRLVFGGAVHKSAFTIDDPRVAEQVVLVDGVSKTYAMTGWRVGYAVGPEDVIKAAGKLQSQSTSGACSIAQAAAAAVLTEGDEAAAAMREQFAARREVMLAALREIPGAVVPEAKGAFYAFPDLSAYYGKRVDGVEVAGSLALSELLLEKAHVAAVPGAAFGADAHLRLSYALGEDAIREGVGRIARVLATAEPGL